MDASSDEIEGGVAVLVRYYYSWGKIQLVIMMDDTGEKKRKERRMFDSCHADETACSKKCVVEK